MDTPLYKSIADQLRTAISKGSFSEINSFPTEHRLSQQFGVSRGTVRRALNELVAEGLISRKQGRGTIVHPALVHSGVLHGRLSNREDLLRYANESEIRFVKLQPQPIPRTVAARFGLQTDRCWHSFIGKRRSSALETPIAISFVWLNPDVQHVDQKIDLNGPTLFEQVEEIEGFSVKGITQDIEAKIATEGIANGLEIEEKEPVLRIVRCYLNAMNEIFEISASYHPGKSFIYSMIIDGD